jgi:hypothetical protein
MADPTQTNITNTTIPDYAKPYVETMLGKAEALTSQNPYQTYPGQRTADFTGLQNESFTGAQNLGPAGQLGVGSNLAGMAGLGSLGVASQANPQGFQQQVGGYMNPYMQQILAPQMQEANRNYDISATNQQSNATKAGAFGGSREAIMAAENERNRNMGLNSIIGQGYNTAFTNAQNQYNQNNALQLQGLQNANQAANTLGSLGSTQFSQELGTLGLQNQFGTQQQQQQQNILSQQYQDFLNQKQYPYQQLSYMSDMLRGLPMSQASTQSYTAPPSTMSQVAGLGTTAAGLLGAYNKATGAAAGGSTKDIQKRRPAGLAELALSKMA